MGNHDAREVEPVMTPAQKAAVILKSMAQDLSRMVAGVEQLAEELKRDGLLAGPEVRDVGLARGSLVASQRLLEQLTERLGGGPVTSEEKAQQPAPARPTAGPFVAPRAPTPIGGRPRGR